MKYLCLVYHDETKLASLSQAEMDALVGECLTSVEELQHDGHHVFSAALQSVRSATTLRHRNGALSVTDGPFAETKEYLAGFTLIEARDLNEAIQLASKLPTIRVGTIEVRPVLDAQPLSTDSLDQKIATAIRHNDHTSMSPAGGGATLALSIRPPADRP